MRLQSANKGRDQGNFPSALGLISIMKRVFLMLGLVLSISFNAMGQTNGFLVFEVDRFAYSEAEPKAGSSLTGRYKIPLTDEFLSNFKVPPSQNTFGTGFLCRAGILNATNDGFWFAWWMHRTQDHRWHVNMWSDGVEKVNGRVMSMGNPSCSQDVTVKNLDDLQMQYMVSFENLTLPYAKRSGVRDGANSALVPDALNVAFTAKFESAEEMRSEKPMPTQPVKKADGSMLFDGDDQSKQPNFKLECLFEDY